MCASACNAAARWNCDGEEAVKDKTGSVGRPTGVLRAVGLGDLTDKWPKDVLPMGMLIGEVTRSALGLQRVLSDPSGVRQGHVHGV